jgi:hypothetical protein
VLKKNIFTQYPSRVLQSTMYLLLSITFCFLYFHKFVVDEDFYRTGWQSGIYTILAFNAPKYAQFRLLFPIIFKIIAVITHIGNKSIFFILIIGQTYIILEIFYRILNEYFIDKTINSLLAPFILYPMVWNYIILNDFYLYYDYTSLLLILLSLLLILRRKNLWLILVFLIGNFNHNSIAFVIVMYILYNYKKLFTKETIIVTLSLTIIFVALKIFFHFWLVSNAEDFAVFGAKRNIQLLTISTPYYLTRDFIFIFGSLHLFALINNKNKWKQMQS